MAPVSNSVTSAPNSTIEWSPVIAGTLLACAISIVLAQFGHALGLSFTDIHSKELITPQSIIVLGIWLLWTQLSASMAGGYMAGRMIAGWHATHEGEIRDGAHGLIVWALSTVLITIAFGITAALAAHGVDDAQARTTITEELAKKYGIISGFALAAASAVSAASAWIMATVGGDHRDNKVDVSKYVSFRKRPRARAR